MGTSLDDHSRSIKGLQVNSLDVLVKETVETVNVDMQISFAEPGGATKI